MALRKLTITIQCANRSTAERLVHHNVKLNASSQEYRESELDNIFKTLHAPALGTFGRIHQSLNTITCAYPNPTAIVRRDFSRVKKALHYPKGVGKVGRHGIETVLFEREEYNAGGHPSRHCTFVNVKPTIKAEPLDAPIPPPITSSAVSLAPIGMSRRVATCPPPGSSTTRLWHPRQHIASHTVHTAAQPSNHSPLLPAMVGLSTGSTPSGTQVFASPSESSPFFAPMFRSTTSTMDVPPLPSRYAVQGPQPHPPQLTYTVSTEELNPSATSFPLTPASPRYQPTSPIYIAPSPPYTYASPLYRPTSPGPRYDTPPWSCTGRRPIPPTDYVNPDSSSSSFSETIDLDPWRLAFNHNSGVPEQSSSCPSGGLGPERQRCFKNERKRVTPYSYPYYHPDVEVLEGTEPIRSKRASNFGKGARMARRGSVSAPSPTGCAVKDSDEEAEVVMGLGLQLDLVPLPVPLPLPAGVDERNMQYVMSYAPSAITSSVTPASALSAVPTSVSWPSSVLSSIPPSVPSSVPTIPSSSPSSRVLPQMTTAQWTARPEMEPPFKFGSSGSLLSPLNLGLDCPPGVTLQGTFQLDSMSASPTTLGPPLSSVSGLPMATPLAPPQPCWEEEDVDLAGASPFFPPGLELGAEKEYHAYGADVSSLSSPDFLPPGLELGVQREYGIVFPGGMMEMKEHPVYHHPRGGATERVDDKGGQPLMTIKRPRLEDSVVVGRDTRKAKRTGGRASGKPYEQSSARRPSRRSGSGSGSESWESSGDDSDTSSTSTSTSGSSSSASSFSSTSSHSSHRSRSGVDISDAELLKKWRKAESRMVSSINSFMEVKKYIEGHSNGDRNEIERGVRKMGKRVETLQREYNLVLNLL